jgi:hypothetical protein
MGQDLNGTRMRAENADIFNDQSLDRWPEILARKGLGISYQSGAGVASTPRILDF